LEKLVQPEVLDQQGLHPDFGAVTLAQLLATWVVHDLNHTHQIVKTMANGTRPSIPVAWKRPLRWPRATTRSPTS